MNNTFKLIATLLCLILLATPVFAGDVNLFGSSAESVGAYQLRQFPKCMI